MKFGKLGKVKDFGRESFGREKKKAAVFLKIAEKLGGRGIVHQTMKLDWYRHIDKALRGETKSKDSKHWKKMRRKFKKNIVGEPSQESLKLLNWMKEFERDIKKEQVIQEDSQRMLSELRKYMESCERQAMDLYIAKNKLMEE